MQDLLRSWVLTLFHIIYLLKYYLSILNIDFDYWKYYWLIFWYFFRNRFHTSVQISDFNQWNDSELFEFVFGSVISQEVPIFYQKAWCLFLFLPIWLIWRLPLSPPPTLCVLLLSRISMFLPLSLCQQVRVLAWIRGDAWMRKNWNNWFQLKIARGVLPRGGNEMMEKYV